MLPYALSQAVFLIKGLLSLLFLTGIAASFAVKLFKAWMAEKDANSVTSSLRKANLDKRLLVSVVWAKGHMFHASAVALSVCAR